MGAVSAYQIILSWVANTFPRPLVKRASAIAICNMIANCANIYGPYMYPSSASPQYIPGSSTNAVVCFVVALLAWGIRIILKRANKKLSENEHETEAQGEVFKYVL